MFRLHVILFIIKLVLYRQTSSFESRSHGGNIFFKESLWPAEVPQFIPHPPERCCELFWNHQELFDQTQISIISCVDDSD